MARRSPAAVRLREALRRPVVAALFLLAAAMVAARGFVTAAGAGTGAPARDYVLEGLAVVAVPGGLVFGVLAAAVAGADFVTATEQLLLSRDPRRLRFVRLHLTVAALLAVLWWACQGGLAVLAGGALEALTAPPPVAAWDAVAQRDWLATAQVAGMALAVTLVYGLLGVAAALASRGSLAGVVALLAYALLGEVVLSPRLDQLQDWTLYRAATLASRPGPLPDRSLYVLGAAGLAAILLSLISYARREVRS